MKKGIVLCTFLIATIGFSQNYKKAGCEIEDDYLTNAGWTQVGDDVQISNGKVEFINGATGGSGVGASAVAVQRRVYRDMGMTLDSNDMWIAELDFHPTSVGTHLGQPHTGHSILALTAGTQEPFSDCVDLPCTGFPIGTQDGINVVYVTDNPPTGDIYFSVGMKDGTSETGSSLMVSNTLDTTYYLRLERISSVLIELSVFSDANRTIHIPNSPITSVIPNTVTGLNTVQHGSIVRGQVERELNGWIDNLCINTSFADIDEIEGYSDYKLYPNPVNDELFILNPDANLLKVSVYNMVGNLIISETVVGPKNSIHMNDFAQGIYLVQVKVEGKVYLHRIVKN